MAKRVAAIAGGARGIGREIALALAERGWDVAIAYRTGHNTTAGHAQSVVQAVRARGAQALALERDVSDPLQAEAFIRDVEREMGRVDALVNCAGPYRRTALLDETPDAWRETFDTNLHPLFYLARAAAPGMQGRRWGRIVGFSMVNADRLQAQTHITAYYIAKAGVLALTRALAKTLGADGITVNAVSPGWIATDNTAVPDLARVEKTVPVGRLGTPNDVVQAVLFLLSDETAYITGANIEVTGGWGL
jgi:3-oxoacyl-[acyl-carrier protein] reductase